MRVLTVAETYFHDIPNGLARVAWDVSREMARRGHEVCLLCPSSRVHGNLENATIEGVQVVRYPQPKVSGFNPFNPWTRVAGYQSAMESLCDRRGWDVVHCHGIYAAAAASAVLPRVPRVLTVHSPALFEQLWNWTHGRFCDWLKLPGLLAIRHFEVRAIASATACHSLSHFTRDAVQGLYPQIAARRWRVISHWADESWHRTVPQADARRMLGWSPNRPVVLAVRQLKPRYGIDVAIRGLAPSIRAGRCELRVCGDGAERVRLERLAQSLEVDGRVHFEGRVTEGHLRLCYQAADVCVIPSVALECFGLIALESFAAGVPVVATAVGGLPEIVAPVCPSLIVPPRDGQRLGEAVHSVLDGAAGTRSSVLEAYVHSAFAAPQAVGHYESLYHEACHAN